MNDQDESLSEDEDVAHPVCPRCFSVMHGRGLFCTNCGPKYSNLDPYGHIATLGDTYREASTRPRKLIMLIGMWLWLGPLAIFFVVVFGYGLVNIHEVGATFQNVNEAFAIVAFVGVFGSLTLGAIILLYRTTRNYLRLKNERT